jgi:hypothetical protein
MQYRSNGEEKNAKQSNDGNIIPLFVCSKLTKGRKLDDKGVKPSLTAVSFSCFASIKARDSCISEFMRVCANT